MHPTRIFKTPEELEKAWTGYKDSLIERAKQWPKVQYVGKDGTKQTDYPKMPLTMSGFEVFCYNNYGCVHHYFDNRDELYNDFGTICSRIKQEIKDDQITGGLLNMYNASITQRLNGLKELSETEHKGQINMPAVPDIGTRK